MAQLTRHIHLRHVTDLADLPLIKRQELHVLDTGETCRLLIAASGDRFEALYVLALTSGMRRDDLLGLNWVDVDFAAGIVRARRSLAYIARHGYLESEPKSPTGRRGLTLASSRLLPSASIEHINRRRG